MNLSSKIYVAGHRGLVGSALVRHLSALGYSNLLLRDHRDLDLTNQRQVRAFFETERPEFVFLAAAKVGGILANTTYPAEFIAQNLQIQNNTIAESHRTGVERLLFLGSSCVYPKLAPQPLKEEYLLTGPLEPTNRPYAVAKIAGIEMCWSYNRQYGTQFLAAMPTNLYGPGDRYDVHDSHVIPALLRKMHEAKIRKDEEVTIWGTGIPRREFLYSDDAADACIFLLNLSADQLASVIGSTDVAPIVNVGSGRDISIRELAELIAAVVEFEGRLVFDRSKPDGTPKKLLDTSRLTSLGWVTGPRSFTENIQKTYHDYCQAFPTTCSQIGSFPHSTL